MIFHINHQKLYLNKGHDSANISVKVIQICGESIALPLKLLLETGLKEKKSPSPKFLIKFSIVPNSKLDFSFHIDRKIKKYNT